MWSCNDQEVCLIIKDCHTLVVYTKVEVATRQFTKFQGKHGAKVFANVAYVFVNAQGQPRGGRGLLMTYFHLAWIPWNSSFRYIMFHEKKTPNDAVTLQRQSQFAPKMKANAVSRLLSSLVWIDQYNECNRMTSFMEFMSSLVNHQIRPLYTKLTWLHDF